MILSKFFSNNFLKGLGGGLAPERADKFFEKLRVLMKIWEKWAVSSPQFFKGLQAPLSQKRLSTRSFEFGDTF